MTQLTWMDVLGRNDLVGGEIEAQKDGVVYRGPLRQIQEDGDNIRFDMPWCARLNLGSGGVWENWHITTMCTPKRFKPHDIGNGRVFFSVPLLGAFTLFPKGFSKLDPRRVKGLPKNPERLLALFPELPFDRATAQRVCCEKLSSQSLEELPADATIEGVLALLTDDSQAEEFLWHYIEAVTGEEVRHRVY